MKIISSTVLVALFAVSQGRFLDATNAVLSVSQTYGTTSYSNSLNCGQCIGLGHTYCAQKAENTQTNSYLTGTSGQYCIQAGTSSSQMTDTSYSCSNAFNDRVYSKYVCQYNTVPCGSTTSFSLPTNGSNNTINVTSLSLGQTCFYKISAACGAITFQPSDASKVEIEYVEFKDADLNTTASVVGLGTASNTTSKRQALPATGMPRRDHYFFAEQGGNQIVGDNQTQQVYNASTNGTMYGRSGRYDKVAGGKKVYGNPTQGAMYGNLTSQSLLDCQNRQVYLAVTATTDQATLSIALGNVAFYRPPASGTSSANFLSMTLAAVLGLLSLAFF